ncbi:MAG TPA: hypothetical protein PLR99_18480 [Polyangiaceae bacterium]|nr:hypothetical protein [Polyangiaceae bacterium]
MRSGTLAISSSTAKRIAAAHPSISDDKVTALLTALVDALFTPSYVEARGLNGEQAAEHRAVLLAGLEAALTDWDRFATLLNIAGAGERAGIVPFLAVQFLGEIGIRIAAYLALHGRLVSARGRIPSWWEAPGIAKAFGWLREHGRATASDAQLRKKAQLQPHTFRDLRDGKRLPKEDTLLQLARAFARPSVDGMTAHETTFELRLACLVAEARQALAVHQDIRAALPSIAFYLSDLRRYSPVELAEIVAQGSQWPRWPEVHERYKVVLVGRLVQLAMGMKAEADRSVEELERVAQQDPAAALRLGATHCGKVAADMREAMSAFPDWERTTGGDMVRLLEEGAVMFSAVANDEPIPSRAGLDRDGFHAKALCETALAPWSDLSGAQREALYRQAVEADPANAEVRFQFGQFLALESRNVEAIPHLKIAVMLDDTYLGARRDLADALFAAGEYAAVLSQVDTLESQEGPSSHSAFLRGGSYFHLGRVRDAHDVFAGVLRASPDDVRCLAGMSEVLEALGDPAGARRHRQRFELLSGQRPPRAIPVPQKSRKGGIG